MSIKIPQGIELHRLDAGAPLTRLDKRAIRTAWIPAVSQALIAPAGFATAVILASTVAVLAAAVGSLFALVLLPAQARGCRRLAAHRIVRADLYAVSGICPYGEYRQWVAALPQPGRLWRALGAPTPQQRLKILRDFRART